MFCLCHPPTENLDAMIAMQTKNKLGKSLGPPDFTGPNGKRPHKLTSKHVNINKMILWSYIDLTVQIYAIFFGFKYGLIMFLPMGIM